MSNLRAQHLNYETIHMEWKSFAPNTGHITPERDTGFCVMRFVVDPTIVVSVALCQKFQQ